MKNILITGGVGGIGSSISKKFLEAGFEVYSLDLTTKDFGKNFHNIICDVTSIEELNKVKASLSGIDVILTKRYDTITKMVEVVKGYAKYEKDI